MNVQGACTVCGRWYVLKKDGTLHVHGSLDKAFPPRPCAGSGCAPRNRTDVLDKAFNYLDRPVNSAEYDKLCVALTDLPVATRLVIGQAVAAENNARLYADVAKDSMERWAATVIGP